MTSNVLQIHHMNNVCKELIVLKLFYGCEDAAIKFTFLFN